MKQVIWKRSRESLNPIKYATFDVKLRRWSSVPSCNSIFLEGNRFYGVNLTCTSISRVSIPVLFQNLFQNPPFFVTCVLPQILLCFPVIILMNFFSDFSLHLFSKVGSISLTGINQYSVWVKLFSSWAQRSLDWADLRLADERNRFINWT